MKRVSVVGYHTTQFGELWEKSFFELVEETIFGVLSENSIEKKQIDAIFFSNMLAGVLENNLHTQSKIAEIMKLNIPIFRVEAACASGGIAFHLANSYLRAGNGQTVLVVGGEKMTDYSPDEIVTGLTSASSGEEQEAGLTFPGLYAMMANFYMQKYKYEEKHLAYVSVKNHYHATFNDKAHFQKEINIEDVLNSPYVAYPLKVLDSSPISDGASSVILTADKTLLKKSKKKAQVLSSQVASDSISLAKRVKLDEILATKIAASYAFAESGLKPKDISVAELHDCFSIAEILAMEDLGFWKKGEGGARMIELPTMIGNSGNLITNPSGGLKATGHPVGATGVKQIGEIFLQVTGSAGKRQVKQAKYGLAHNVGGSGGTAVVTILGS